MRRDAELQTLFDEVVRTREAHRLLLGRRLDRLAILRSRLEWLVALEEYVVALEEHRLPTPRVIHADIAILRELVRDGQRS